MRNAEEVNTEKKYFCNLLNVDILNEMDSCTELMGINVF